MVEILQGPLSFPALQVICQRCKRLACQPKTIGSWPQSGRRSWCWVKRHSCWEQSTRAQCWPNCTLRSYHEIGEGHRRPRACNDGLCNWCEHLKRLAWGVSNAEPHQKICNCISALLCHELRVAVRVLELLCNEEARGRWEFHPKTKLVVAPKSPMERDPLRCFQA